MQLGATVIERRLERRPLSGRLGRGEAGAAGGVAGAAELLVSERVAPFVVIGPGGKWGL